MTFFPKSLKDWIYGFSDHEILVWERAVSRKAPEALQKRA